MQSSMSSLSSAAPEPETVPYPWGGVGSPHLNSSEDEAADHSPRNSVDYDYREEDTSNTMTEITYRARQLQQQRQQQPCQVHQWQEHQQQLQQQYQPHQLHPQQQLQQPLQMPQTHPACQEDNFRRQNLQQSHSIPQGLPLPHQESYPDLSVQGLANFTAPGLSSDSHSSPDSAFWPQARPFANISDNYYSNSSPGNRPSADAFESAPLQLEGQLSPSMSDQWNYRAQNLDSRSPMSVNLQSPTPLRDTSSWQRESNGQTSPYPLLEDNRRPQWQDRQPQQSQQMPNMLMEQPSGAHVMTAHARRRLAEQLDSMHQQHQQHQQSHQHPTQPLSSSSRGRDFSFGPGPASKQTTEAGNSATIAAAQRAIAGAMSLPLEPSTSEGLTTLMVRNIPVLYTQDMLMKEWTPFWKYDFLYLPVGTEYNNASFAFINFTTAESAAAFRDAWHKQRLARFRARKSLNVSFAQIQGLTANVLRHWNAVSRQSPDGQQPQQPQQPQPAIFLQGQRMSLEESLTTLGLGLSA